MVRFSLELAVKCPVTELAPYLRELDGSGFHRVWVPDAPNSQWELWSAATLAVMSTSQSRVGVGVTSPFQRSPAVIAHAAATLDHLSRGRIDLSLGRGIRPFLEHIGAPGADVGVGEGIEILRRLLRGERVTYKGEVFRFEDVQLPLGSLQERLPILVAAMSERWMEVASSVADGIHTYSVNERLLQTAREWARRAARPDFAIVTTVAYIEPKEARERWLRGIGSSQGLLSLMGVEPGRGSWQELEESLTLSGEDDLRRKAERLERLGVDELMIAYRRPEDLPVLGEWVNRLAL